MGEFRDGVFSGQGQLIYKDMGGSGLKAVYVGNFKSHKRNGYGEITWGSSKSDAEVFKGIWCNDKRVQGWLRLPDGTEYDGEWKDDVMHGKGRLTFKSERKGEKGIIYEGIFN